MSIWVDGYETLADNACSFVAIGRMAYFGRGEYFFRYAVYELNNV
jgi:hypothetical protein